VIKGAISDNRIANVAACVLHSIAVAQNGSLYTWGTNYENFPATYYFITSGVKSFEEFSFSGFLGQGSTSVSMIPAAASTSVNNFAGAACGRHHSVAYTKSGKVYAWGDNSRGQVGASTAVPYLVTSKSIDSRIIVSVAAGQRHTVVL
jgi:hypothetical protein